jgi:hypothetical protein
LHKEAALMVLRRQAAPGWRWGVAGVLVGLGLAWTLGADRSPTAQAQGPTPTPLHAAAGTLAFATGTPGGEQWLYLIDTRTQALAVYRINGKGMIKLEAARQYHWDLMLSEYNNQPPEPSAIESMIHHRQSSR